MTLKSLGYLFVSMLALNIVLNHFGVKVTLFPPRASEREYIRKFENLGLLADESPYVNPDPALVEILAVGKQNFDADVITYLMVVAIIGFVILFPAAGELGKRSISNSSKAPA